MNVLRESKIWNTIWHKWIEFSFLNRNNVAITNLQSISNYRPTLDSIVKFCQKKERKRNDHIISYDLWFMNAGSIAFHLLYKVFYLGIHPAWKMALENWLRGLDWARVTSTQNFIMPCYYHVSSRLQKRSKAYKMGTRYAIKNAISTV